MQELLDELYQTSNTIHGFEKTASAEELEEYAIAVADEELEKRASVEGIDTDDFTEEQYVAVMREIMAEQAAEGFEKVASADELEFSDSDLEKIAEWDAAGRVMAHAFHAETYAIQEEYVKEASAHELFDVTDEEFNEAALDEAYAILAEATELDEIEKTAGAWAGIKRYAQHTKDLGKNYKKARAYTSKIKAPGAVSQTLIADATGRVGNQKDWRNKARMDMLRGSVMPAAGLTLTAGGTVVAVGKSKKASSDDVTSAALEMLHEAGHDIEYIAELIDSQE